MPDPTLLQVKVLHLKKGSIFGKAKKRHKEWCQVCVFSCHFLIFKKFAPKVRFEDNFKKRRYGSQKETAKIKRKAEKVSFTGGGGVGVCVCVWLWDVVSAKRQRLR